MCPIFDFATIPDTSQNMTSQPAKPNIQTAIDFSDIPPSYNELYPQVNTEPPVSPTTTPRTETLSVTESAVTFSNQECQQRNQVVVSFLS